MQGILRTWMCLNARCKAQFDSWEANPECSKCGCVRVSWMPGGGHVSKDMRRLDASLNSLAKSYGMGNINSPSPSRLNRAMPKLEPRIADGPVLNFAPGFAAPFNRGGLATCEPSHQRVDFKVTAASDKPLVPQAGRNYPKIGADNWKSVRRAFKP